MARNRAFGGADSRGHRGHGRRTGNPRRVPGGSIRLKEVWGADEFSQLAREFPGTPATQCGFLLVVPRPVVPSYAQGDGGQIGGLPAQAMGPGIDPVDRRRVRFPALVTLAEQPGGPYKACTRALRLEISSAMVPAERVS